MHSNGNELNRQRGAVLAICMIVLLVLTLLSLSGARSVILQEKMTSASRDAQLALQAAEAALHAAESEIYSLSSLDDFAKEDGVSHHYRTGNLPLDLLNPSTWENAEKLSASEGIESSSRYLIEEVGELAPAPGVVEDPGNNQVSDPSFIVFRIVARGQGRGGTERILIAHYSKKFL